MIKFFLVIIVGLAGIFLDAKVQEDINKSLDRRGVESLAVEFCTVVIMLLILFS